MLSLLRSAQQQRAGAVVEWWHPMVPAWAASSSPAAPSATVLRPTLTLERPVAFSWWYSVMTGYQQSIAGAGQRMSSGGVSREGEGMGQILGRGAEA